MRRGKPYILSCRTLLLIPLLVSLANNYPTVLHLTEFCMEGSLGHDIYFKVKKNLMHGVGLTLMRPFGPFFSKVFYSILLHLPSLCIYCVEDAGIEPRINHSGKSHPDNYFFKGKVICLFLFFYNRKKSASHSTFFFMNPYNCLGFKFLKFSQSSRIDRLPV